MVEFVPVDHDPFEDKAQAITIRPVSDSPDVPDPNAGPVPDPNDPNQGSSHSLLLDKLLGLGGQERYQTWPEKLVRSALDAPHAAMTSEAPITSEEMIPPAQDIAGLAGLGSIGRTPNAAIAASDTAAGAPLAALEHAPKFYSGLERGIDTLPDQTMTGAQWANKLWEPPTTKRVGIRDEKNKPTGEFKTVEVQGRSPIGSTQEELQHTGVLDFLEANRDQPLTKQEVADHVAGNKVQLGEVEKGARQPPSPAEQAELADLERRFADKDMTLNYNDAGRLAELRMKRDALPDSANPTKFSSYQLPGGENYREKLLTLPKVSEAQKYRDMLADKYGPVGNFVDHATQAERDQLYKLMNQPRDDYRSSHWDEPNVLVHRRTNEREVNGVPSLHLEEIQSDFMQDYRRQKMAISDAIDKDFDGIADRMVKAGVIKRVCD